MNVLEKIKSKKLKTQLQQNQQNQQNQIKSKKPQQKQQQNKQKQVLTHLRSQKLQLQFQSHENYHPKSQTFLINNTTQQQQRNQPNKKQHHLYQQKSSLSNMTSIIRQTKKSFNLMNFNKNLLGEIINTNILTKQKQNKLRQKQFFNSQMSMIKHSSVFDTKNTKNQVHFQQKRQLRPNPFLTLKNQQKSLSSQFNEDELDIDQLLNNKSKKTIKSNIHQSKGKYEDIIQIQNQLKEKNKNVLGMNIKKLEFYGDVLVLEGEIYSVKGQGIYNQFLERKTGEKSTGKMKVFLSCPSSMMVLPETIGRMYLSKVDFLSENQIMICHDYLLRTIQKSNRMSRNQ